MLCVDCVKAETQEVTIDKYFYQECGLPNVVLHNIKGMCCQACGSTSPVISSLETIHKVIGQAICLQPFLLTSKDIRYLRKHSNKSINQWAHALRINCRLYKMFERDPEIRSVSRPQWDATIRLLYAQIQTELGQPFPGLISKVLDQPQAIHGQANIIINTSDFGYWYE